MKTPLITLLAVILCCVSSSCSKKPNPAPESNLEAAETIREYANSFVGLDIEEAKKRLSPSIISEEEWIDDGIVDGKYISVEYDQYDLLLMCHNGFVLTASIDISSNK